MRGKGILEEVVMKSVRVSGKSVHTEAVSFDSIYNIPEHLQTYKGRELAPRDSIRSPWFRENGGTGTQRITGFKHKQ